MRNAPDGAIVMHDGDNRQLIQSIADETFQRRIEAERRFIADTFKTALWIAGLALSAVIAIFGFAGWQRFNDVQTEAREHAQKEVQRYIDEQAALKDARAELDRQYGEALVRTLRNGRNGSSDLDEEFAVSRSQIDRLLQVLLLPETSKTLFEETAELIAEIGTDAEADWFPQMQDKLIQQGVLTSALGDVFPERRDRIVELLSEIGTKSAANTLRNLLKEQHLSPESARAVLDFERRIRLESPMEKSVLLDYMQRRGPDELVASARALALFAYPSEKDSQSWLAPLKEIRADQQDVYALTLENILHDAFGRGSTRGVTEFRQEVLRILQRVTRECARVQFELDDISDLGEIGSALRSELILINCFTASSNDSVELQLTAKANEFSGFVATDLRETFKQGADELAMAIDRWSLRQASGVGLMLAATSVSSSATISLGDKVVFASVRRGVYELTTVPDPSNAGKRLPALKASPAGGEPTVIPFDSMHLFGLSAQLIRVNQMQTAIP